MSDTNMKSAKECDEGIKAYDALYGDLSPHNRTKSNESSGDSIEDPDCTIDDAKKAQFQAKYGDAVHSKTTPRVGRGHTT